MIALLDEISAPTRRLSEYIAEAVTRPLPDAVVEKARHHVLDTLAAMVSGSQLRPGRMAIGYVASLGGVPEASVVGTPIAHLGRQCGARQWHAGACRRDRRLACAVTHASRMCRHSGGACRRRAQRAPPARRFCVRSCSATTSRRASTIRSAPMRLPPPRAVPTASVAYSAPVPPPGHCSVFDAVQVRHLLSYCAQQASGVGCNVRDSEHIEKAFDFGGMPARNGVAAATMVAHGFTGVDDVFAGERNFFEAYAPEPDPSQLAEELGERFEILSTNIKKWSVGSPAQSALDALTCLMESEKPALDEIAAIRVHLPARSARTVDNAPMPDVNVQHLMALLLVDGRLTFHSVHDHGRMKDPAVLAVRRKIELVPSQELMEARPRRQAIVEIDLRDGRRLSHRTIAVRGTADNPMTRDEVEAKALDLMAAHARAGARRRTRDCMPRRRAMSRHDRVSPTLGRARSRARGRSPPDAVVVERRCRGGARCEKLHRGDGGRLSRARGEPRRQRRPFGNSDADRRATTASIRC